MIKLDMPDIDGRTPADLEEFAMNLDKLQVTVLYMARAMRARQAGNLVEAQRHERHCNLAYDLLPEEWKE